MRAVKRNGVVAMHYSYDGLGQQVRRYQSATDPDQRHYLYDEAGRWLGEYDLNGAPKQQIVWLDDLPVGLIDAGGAKYIEPDHLGTPRAVIDPVRDVAVWAWDAKGEAFGNSPPHEDPDADGTALVFDMRFPGQRYDAATGLHYNYFRDYDPATGRYVQSDLIGLLAGVSTYGYVGGSPLVWFDPDGMQAIPVPQTPPSSTPGTRFTPQNLPPVNDPVYGPNRRMPVIGPVLRACATPQGALFILLMAIPNSTTECDTLDKPPECGGGDNSCPPCRLVDGTIVPKGTIGYRLDRVPPSKPHYPYLGDHYNLSRANQNPNNCQCFWQPIGAADGAGGLPPPLGSIPIQPFMN